MAPLILQPGSSCGTRFIGELVEADSAYVLVVRIEENKPPVRVPAWCQPMGFCLNARAPDNKSKQLFTLPLSINFHLQSHRLPRHLPLKVCLTIDASRTPPSAEDSYTVNRKQSATSPPQSKKLQKTNPTTVTHIEPDPHCYRRSTPTFRLYI